MHKDGASVLLHIGYYKTGSTWLQEDIFDDSALGVWRPASLRRLLDDFVLCDPFSFDAAALRSAYDSLLLQPPAPGLLPVLSHERFAGAPSSGGVDARQIADRLVETFPKARVLIVIRRQADIIRSSYLQYLRSGGTASLSTFLSLPSRQHGEVPVYRLNFHAYDGLIEHYQTKFGRASVLVLPFEMLRADQAGFVQKVLAHMGLVETITVPRRPRNLSQGVTSLAFRRPLNLLFARNSNHLGAPFYIRGTNLAVKELSEVIDRIVPAWADRMIEHRWQRTINRAVTGRFRTSNQRVQDLTGLDLAKHGYEV